MCLVEAWDTDESGLYYTLAHTMISRLQSIQENANLLQVEV